MFKALKEFLFGKLPEQAEPTAPYKVEAAPEPVPAPTPAPAVVAEPAEVKVEVQKEVEKAEPKKAKNPKKAQKSTAKAEVAANRSRKGGKFVGDDKSTPGVNEAFKSGKSTKAKAKKAPQ